MHTNWGINCTLKFTDWKCKELSSQESQTIKMLCVIYKIGAPPLYHKTSHYASSSAWYVRKVMLSSLFCIECLIKQLNCYACSSAEISSIIVTNSSTLTLRYFCLINNYSLKAKWILSNNPRDEVEGIIRQYSLSLRRITVLV